MNYIGNYDYYLEKHDQMVALYVKKPEDEAQTEASVKETAQKVDWQTQKAEQATDPQDRECPEKGRGKDCGAGRENCFDRCGMCKAGSGCELCKVRRTDETAE